jgi:class 3 adenylate cyclase
VSLTRECEIGDGHHYEFHVFDDPVNVVSRIQQHNRSTGTRVLASQEALEGVEGAIVNELGEVSLRGESQTVKIYELQDL